MRSRFAVKQHTNHWALKRWLRNGIAIDWRMYLAYETKWTDATVNADPPVLEPTLEWAYDTVMAQDWADHGNGNGAYHRFDNPSTYPTDVYTTPPWSGLVALGYPYMGPGQERDFVTTLMLDEIFQKQTELVGSPDYLELISSAYLWPVKIIEPLTGPKITVDGVAHSVWASIARAHRMRYRVSANVSGWIGSSWLEVVPSGIANQYNLQLFDYPNPEVSFEGHLDLKASPWLADPFGTTGPWYEIEVPWYEFTPGTEYAGIMKFHVLGETPTAWEARTGITVNYP